MAYLGAHISIAGGIDLAPARARALDCDVMQIFTKNQRRWKSRPFGEKEISLFHSNIKKNGIKSVCSHTSYLINLGSPDKTQLAKSRIGFLDELKRAKLLHIPFLVIHPGSHKGSGEKKCLEIISQSLDWSIEKQPLRNLKILLETTAGQGTNVGYRFQHLRDIISLTKYPDDIGVCYDTCHTFAAGYDIRKKDIYNETFRTFDKIIGIEKLFVFHLNDSKKELGSKIDRHENIGKGLIGKEPFGFLLKDKRFQNHPMILETPGGEKWYKKNLETLRSLYYRQE
jgi:deoxyribonuclease-4